MLLLLSACGGGASPNGSVPPPAPVPPVTPPAAPTATLTANPVAVGRDGTSTLTWSSTDATACTAAGGWNGTLASAGTRLTAALTQTSTYSLTCSGPGGASAAATVSVTVTPVVVPAPTASLTALPTTVARGAASTLTWSSTNATSCAGSGGSFAGAKVAAGSQTTGALSATTLYSMTCTGSGGTSAPASATVTIAGAAIAVSPRAAGIALTRTQQFTATVSGGGTPAWSVDSIAGGNAVAGTIDGSGLFTAGTAAGLHTVSAVSGADTGTATVGVTDSPGVLTYHNDAARDGANTQEYALTTATVTAGSFGKLKACAVDGAIYAQPLWMPNVTVNSAKHNLVFVATQHDGLYAFDADSASCTPLWQVSLVDANHGGATGETSVPSTLLGSGYGDTVPEVGITGTPVIDAGSGTLYVLAKSVNAAHTAYFQRLHAIDVTSGVQKVAPALVSASVAGAASGGSMIAFDARQEGQRAGLSLVNGVVYIAWASHEDQTPYFGWMLGYRIAAGVFTQTAAFNAAKNTGKAGIWMSGGAPAADGAGNLYVVTGNGIFDVPHLDYGDSLLKLTAGLTVSDTYTPADQSNDNTNDADFGSGGAAVLADLTATSGPAHLIICGDKSGYIYVLNRDSLGGYDTGGTKAVQKVSAGSLFATGAFWNNVYYIGRINGPMLAFTFDPSRSLFGTSPSSSTASNFGARGGTPSISSSGPANGILWALDSAKYCTKESPGCGPAVLHAYDATNLRTELWNSAAAANAADAAGYAVKFTVPTIANGKVYVGTRGNNIGGASASTSRPGELDIYGLLP